MFGFVLSFFLLLFSSGVCYFLVLVWLLLFFLLLFSSGFCHFLVLVLPSVAGLVFGLLVFVFALDGWFHEFVLCVLIYCGNIFGKNWCHRIRLRHAHTHTHTHAHTHTHPHTHTHRHTHTHTHTRAHTNTRTLEKPQRAVEP